METLSDARRIIRFSLNPAGAKPGSWNGERIYSAWKMCECCGKKFYPFISEKNKMKEQVWKRQRFCSIRCSKIKENPMNATAAREKIKTRMAGKIIPMRSGNGKTHALQAEFAKFLPADWMAEYAVTTTQAQRAEHAPNAYKIDFANPGKMIGIELDGASHRATERRGQDIRKSQHLAQSGWKIFRLSNSTARNLCIICKSKDTPLITLLERLFIIAI